MTPNTVFWILMLVWLVLGIGWGWRDSFGGTLILFILIAMLGWKIFGTPFKGW
ncbi:MAG TPA: hypothetical protein VEP90_23210 [Methylomirabilota bacterium]|nr:hypothetical protein [Methylomirabilota bacterium]